MTGRRTGDMLDTTNLFEYIPDIGAYETGLINLFFKNLDIGTEWGEAKMLPYLLLGGTSLTGSLLPERKPAYQRAFLLGMGVLYWLLASLRYVTGFDYRFYEKYFCFTATSDIAGLATFGQIEPGYRLLNVIVSGPGGDYRVFLFVFHFLFTALVFVWLARYSAIPWMSAYLFLTLQYFALGMNFLRQALAGAIILWIYPFLKSRRLLPCFGLILLASCFHRTALIMLPLCILLSLRPSKLHYGLSALAAVSGYFLMDPFIKVVVSIVPKYQHYLTEKYWQGNSFRYLLMPIGCFLIALPLIRRAMQVKSESPVLANSMFYALLMQVFITKHFILERLSIYVAFFALIALPEAIRAADQRTARLRTGLLLGGCFLYFLFAASQGFHGVYPFHGIWDKAQTLAPH